MTNRFRLLCLVLALMLVQAMAIAAPSRDVSLIDMDEEQLELLRSSIGQQAIQAFHQANPGLPLDLSQDGLGMHIYELDMGAAAPILKADLYQVEGMQLSPEEAPEDGVRWLAHCEVVLQQDQAAPGGYKALDMRLSPPYQAKGFVSLQLEEAGLELLLPDCFHLPEQAALPLQLTSDDGKAQLTVSLRPVAGVTMLTEQQRLLASHPDILFAPEADYGPDIEGHAPGYSVLVVLGADQAYSLELSYPQELAHEYSLYFQFMRNGFVVSEIAVG